MSWNYRVFCHRGVGPSGKPFAYYAIHDTYYDKQKKIDGMGAEPMHPQGDTLDELRGDVSAMRKALDRPILEWSDYEKEKADE